MEHLIKQLLMQRSQSLKTAEKASPRTVQRIAPTDRMPLIQKDGDDGLARDMNANDIAVAVERGEKPAQALHQGLGPADIARAYTLGGQMRGYGGEPMLKPMPLPEAGQHDAMMRGPGQQLSLSHDPSLEERRAQADKVGQFVSKHGYHPEMFRDKSEAETARLLADQLQRQRELAGDPTAWWMAASPSL